MYIPKRKVVCAMISEIDFKVKGEKRRDRFKFCVNVKN